LARASRFGQIADYGPTAGAQISLLVQVENRKGLEALDEILGIDGIDGVFIGPADLAADLGHLGDSLHPEVTTVILDAIARIRASGKAPGILSTNDKMLQDAMAAGAQFVAVGLDVQMLLQSAKATAAKWQGKS
jgi:4-hydroxy-2-oxoheptanedioate aldolase